VNILKNCCSKIRDYFEKKPKMIIVVTALVFFLSLIVFEYIRASIYLNTVDDYKKSEAILRVKETADKLTRASQVKQPAIFCDIDHKDLLKEVNKAYDNLTNENNPELLISMLNSSVKQAGSPPIFNSFLQFIPKIHQARIINQEIQGSMEALASLTTTDERSSYCTSLVGVLGEIYFLTSIETPEGVSALFVGQLENFQVNTKQAQKTLQAISPPTVFIDQHTELNQLLNKIALDLRNNSNKYIEFSRIIEKDVDQLEIILGNIKSKTQDLQSRPSQIALQASLLE
jgi:hypothetical protein